MTYALQQPNITLRFLRYLFYNSGNNNNNNTPRHTMPERQNNRELKGNLGGKIQTIFVDVTQTWNYELFCCAIYPIWDSVMSSRILLFMWTNEWYCDRLRLKNCGLWGLHWKFCGFLVLELSINRNQLFVRFGSIL